MDTWEFESSRGCQIKRETQVRNLHYDLTVMVRLAGVGHSRKLCLNSWKRNQSAEKATRKTMAAIADRTEARPFNTSANGGSTPS